MRGVTELGRRILALLIVPALASCLLAADDAEHRISAHLLAGEFGPAKQIAEHLDSRQARDNWLGQIAAGQAAAGAGRASVLTASEIHTGQTRGSTFDNLQRTPVGRAGARGGAALADFDTLINLITTTVEPESWDTIGGPGAIERFPTGVRVDASGLLRTKDIETKGVGLKRVRSSASVDRGNRDPRAASRLRKVSLSRLERHIQMRAAMGVSPDAAMRNFAGLYDVQYVLVYPETRDIVLAGPAGDWVEGPDGQLVSDRTGAPVLRLDDFVVVLRNALRGDGVFGCAITPRRDSLASVQRFLASSAGTPLRQSRRAKWLADLREQLGEQDIEVFGIDPRTTTARVLVEADYHMKLVGMGLEDGTMGVDSYLDTVTLDADGNPPAMDVLRWWFTVNYEGVRTTASRDGFELVGAGVKVLSENELLNKSGDRIHTGSSDVLNQRFAQSFTKEFDQLAEKYPVYAELRNVFDLALVAAIIRQERLTDRADWGFDYFLEPQRYPLTLGVAPTRVASVVNHRSLGRRHLIVGVSGGVRAEFPNLADSSLLPDENSAIAQTVEAAAPTLPSHDTWWWD